MNTLAYIILNVVFIVIVVVVNIRFRRYMTHRQNAWETSQMLSDKMKNDVEQDINVLAGSETDPDYNRLVQIKRAKKKYCMAYNKENDLYCSHSKDHRARHMWGGPSYTHKTHEAKGIRWAMERMPEQTGTDREKP